MSSVYLLIISVTWSFLLFFLAMGSFFGMEALRLKNDHRVSTWFKLLLCSIIYWSYAWYHVYKLFLENEKNKQFWIWGRFNHVPLQEEQDQELKLSSNNNALLAK